MDRRPSAGREAGLSSKPVATASRRPRRSTHIARTPERDVHAANSQTIEPLFPRVHPLGLSGLRTVNARASIGSR